MTNLTIATAGWSYRHWVGPFYPEGTKSRDFLDHYTRHFAATEINNTFYTLPKPDTLAGWRDATPAGFTFAVKASRYITHMKKLKDPADSVARFLDGVRPLGAKLGPVLFQLPPNWKANPERLRAFLEGLPDGYRYVFEFRDPSWFAEQVTELLKAHNAAFCVYDLEGETTPAWATADFAYVRLHGPNPEAYTGSYADAALDAWADRIARWREQGRDVYVFFDNDEAGHAANDALRLQRRLAGS